MSRPKVIVAHVMFVDLVRSSALSLEAFGQTTSEFRRLLLETSEFRTKFAQGRAQAEDTGDGLSIAFLDDPASPVECLAEILEEVKGRTDLTFRAGIHSGPLLEVDGIQGKKLTGVAFAEAKRVMEAALPGQVLLSTASADILGHFERWSDRIGRPRTVRGKDRQTFRVYEFSRESPVVPSNSGSQKEAVSRPTLGRTLVPLLAIAAFALGSVLYSSVRFAPTVRSKGGSVRPRQTGPIQTWDVGKDFDKANRPGSPWSFGTRVEGRFVKSMRLVIKDIIPSTGTTPPKRSKPTVYHSPSWFSLWKNTLSEVAYGVEPGDIAMQSDGETPDIRWTAPKGGSYNIFVQVGGRGTGDRFGRGNYNADRAGMLIDERPIRSTVFINNISYFHLYGVQLAQGQTVDVFVDPMIYGGNCDTKFTVMAMSTP